MAGARRGWPLQYWAQNRVPPNPSAEWLNYLILYLEHLDLFWIGNTFPQFKIVNDLKVPAAKLPRPPVTHPRGKAANVFFISFHLYSHILLYIYRQIYKIRTQPCFSSFFKQKEAFYRDTYTIQFPAFFTYHISVYKESVYLFFTAAHHSTLWKTIIF